MTYTFKTQGVCAAKINFDIEDGIVKNVQFMGGCNGNTQGVAKLAEGRPAEELISILQGIKCGFKQTSCPDQFSKALQQALNGEI
jgi:uncharacterized protein (TIGR03905 family)